MVLGMVALHDFVYPVLAARSADDDADLLKPLVYGTAFCIGPGLFLTAGHVLQSVEADGGCPMLGVRSPEPGSYLGALARRTEILARHDVGLLGVRLAAPAALDWQDPPLGLLDDVCAVGYPYSVDFDDEAQQWVSSIRGFKGSVITRRQLRHLPGKPVGYEVDARFPKGLSGAPVTPQGFPHPIMRIVGMVLGEQTVEVEGQTTTFGLVLDIAALLDVESKLIGGTFRQLRDNLLDKAARARERETQRAAAEGFGSEDIRSTDD